MKLANRILNKLVMESSDLPKKAILNRMMKMNDLGVIYGYINSEAGNIVIGSVEKTFRTFAPDDDPESKKTRSEEELNKQLIESKKIIISNISLKDVGYIKMPDGTIYEVSGFSRRTKALSKVEVKEKMNIELE
jgi:hypothetical protein